jgi:Ca2+-transporting ATPase
MNHSKTIDELFADFHSGFSGLKSTQIEELQTKFGSNTLKDNSKPVIWLILVRQLKSFLIYILLVAAGISALVGHMTDVYVILTVIVLNALIGFVQEYKAETAIKALKGLVVDKATVFRDGEMMKIEVAGMVPGDVVYLEEGDKIPADGRVIESRDLQTMEASVTGESTPRRKIIDALPEQTELGDRDNMVWMGTFVTTGRGKILVTDIGMNTVVGRIAKDLDEMEPQKSHFAQKTDKLAIQMAVVAIVIPVIVFLVGYFVYDIDLLEILLFAVASIVSGIPEGLPAILVIVLGIGAYRMSQKKALIRHLPVTESLAVTSMIITDKTGTITQNTMTVQEILVGSNQEFVVSGEGWEPKGEFLQNDQIAIPLDKKDLSKLLHICALCNNAKLVIAKDSQNKKDIHSIIGDPTEGALVVLAQKAGLDRNNLSSEIEILDDMLFNSDLKFRATLIRDIVTKEEFIYTVGAPEVILSRSHKYLLGEEQKNLSDGVVEDIKKWQEKSANNAHRVLAMGFAKVDEKLDGISPETVKNLVFVGAVGMMDPPRSETKEAITKARKAGISVIMDTGDYETTALSIARIVGLVDPKTHGKELKSLVCSEKDLLAMTESEFNKAVNTVSIFARLSPHMKFRLAEHFQKAGHIVAMTGDGVNDAPALKRADVGISMGIMGTDVARASSDIVLMDDNFASIIDAIEQGRIIYRNIRQTSTYLITTTFAEGMTILITILFGWPLPLMATQLLMINLVTDTFTNIGLATEKGHGDILSEPPFKEDRDILSRDILPFLIMISVIMAVLGVATLMFYLDMQGADLATARTAVFVVIAFTQIFNVYNLRSPKRSLFDIGIFSNKYVNYGVGLSSSIALLAILWEPMQRLFSFKTLPLAHLVVLIGLSSIVIFVSEIYKILVHGQVPASLMRSPKD